MQLSDLFAGTGTGVVFPELSPFLREADDIVNNQLRPRPTHTHTGYCQTNRGQNTHTQVIVNITNRGQGQGSLITIEVNTYNNTQHIGQNTHTHRGYIVNNNQPRPRPTHTHTGHCQYNQPIEAKAAYH